MKITALEIKQHEFEKSFRGYNIEEVDIFLNNLASEWERTSNESKMLRMQLEIAEKEAAKLREVEMSLIKTLQNAEITSNKITEQAQKEADIKVEQASLEAQNILANAKEKAETILVDAQTSITESQKELESKEHLLKAEISELESYKTGIVDQIRAISSNAMARIEGLTHQETVKEIKLKEEAINLTETQTEALVEEAEGESVQGIASSANNLVLNETPESKKTQLTVIEGIGPKIAELLIANNITTFRDVATTPSYRIKEILGYAGNSYSMHDPSSWAEQAVLADSQKWEELEALKVKLIGGREITESPENEAPKETQEQVTEEMLERVNKVKAALKKAMVEKEGGSALESAPKVKTINDLAAEKSSGSFFDNL
ncbi:MAG: cell division initiation protein [Arcticibacterium sp.]|jgi:cell division initiation protein